MDRFALCHEEFAKLLQGFLDETLSGEEYARFVDLLQKPDAQDLYIDAIHMDNSLRYWAGVEGVLQRRSAAMLAPLGSDAPSRRAPWAGWSVAIVAPAACLLLGWVLGTTYKTSQPPSNSAPSSLLAERRDGLNIAGQVVSFTPDSEWFEADLAVMKGTGLRPGQCLELKRGVAEIQFTDGGSAILAGPASIEIQSGRSAFLHKGNATFVSTDPSQDLTVSTPSSRCLISNSQVGASVNDQGAVEVQVLSGTTLVSLLNESGGVVQRRRLSKGVGAKFDASTELISKIAYDGSSYVRRVDESFIAYRNFAGLEGNQEFEGTLGMDFVVKDPIVVTKLGVFDSEADGLKRTIKAAIWARDEARSAYRFDDDFGAKIIAEMTFSPDSPGTLVQSNRMKALAQPVALRPGAYTIVASGYGKGEPNGNEGDYFYDHASDTAKLLPAPGLRWRGEDLPVGALKRLDDGRGAVLFVGCARWDTHVGEFPRVVDGGAVNRFRAGTFEFQRQDSGQRYDLPKVQLPLRDSKDGQLRSRKSDDPDTI